MTQPQRHARASGSLLVLAVLALTAALALAWSHARLLWQDEFLSFYSDSASTAFRVVEIQLHSPISLDPPTYHLLSHFAMNVVGRNAIALRLPALLGFLLMQLAIFGLVRRLAGSRAAVIAMSLPLICASFRYTVEGRPYGLLMGLYGAAMLCWYQAARRRDESADRSAPRAWPLLGLALSIALAITSHYFGVLIAVPIAIGELARISQRRRLDWAVLVAFVAGLFSIVLILPFRRALLPYRTHYYINAVGIHDVSQGYRELFVQYGQWPMAAQRTTAFALLAVTIALFYFGYRRFRTHAATEPAYIWIALLAFVSLPFFSFLFGRFVTHTMEVRYVAATIIPFVVVIGLLLEQRLRSTRFFASLLAAVLILGVILTAVQIQAARKQAAGILNSMELPPHLASTLARNPSENLYTQSLSDFFLNSYYAATPELRSRMVLVYDPSREVRWLDHNTNAVTAIYLQHFSPLKVMTYCEFLSQPHPLLLFYPDSWAWIGKEMDATHVKTEPLGTALRAELFRIDAPQPCTATSQEFSSSPEPSESSAHLR